MKNKKIKSEKVKMILKKSFDVFCYVVTALAITLGIAVGVNKCSSSAATQEVAADLTKLSQPSNSTVIRERAEPNTDDLTIFKTIYSGELEIDFDYLRSSANVSTSLSSVRRSSRTIYYYLDGYVWADGIYYESPRLSFRWDDLAVTSTTAQYEYKLYNIYIRVPSGTYKAIYERVTEYASTGDVGNFSPTRFILSNDSEYTDSELFTAFFEETTKSAFTFNESFNYNAPFNLNVNAVYGTTSFDGGSEGMKYKDFDIGWFISNGQIFDRIRWWAINSAGVSVMIGGNVSTLTSDIDWVYTFMYYVNTETGNEVLVNQRDSIPYNGGNSRYYANSTTWIVPSYRNIVLLTELSNTLRDSLESFNNNNQTSYGGGVVTSEVNDVFSLIASAFSGLLPILTLAILPNITIGTLLFVPLVAMLVFAIIRIIKK